MSMTSTNITYVTTPTNNNNNDDNNSQEPQYNITKKVKEVVAGWLKKLNGTNGGYGFVLALAIVFCLSAAFLFLMTFMKIKKSQ